MVAMKTLRKTLLALFASVAVLFAVVPTAGADYTNQTTCATAVLGSRVCIDISANTATIYKTNTTVWMTEAIAGPLVAVGPLPTKGWIAYGPSCYGAGSNTAFQTGPGFNLNSQVVTIFAGSGSHSWNNVPVSGAFASLSAWLAASDNAFECVIVP